MRRREFILSPLLIEISSLARSGTLSHPRLYFDAKKVERIRQRIAGEPEFARRWRQLLERANGMAASSGRGPITGIAMTLGLAWQVTGDKQYAEALKQVLLVHAGMKEWDTSRLDRNPPWHSALGSAQRCFGCGVGYDAIHDFLSPADRKAIAEAMIRLGILPALQEWVLPETRIHSLDSMGHNWWSACVGTAGVASLSLLGEDERAAGWVDAVARGLELWLGYRGNVLQNKSTSWDRAGAFYESVNYANFAIQQYLWFRLAWSNVFRDRKPYRSPLLEKAVEFFIHTLYPASSSFWTVYFGDSSEHTNAAWSVRLLLQTGFEHPSAGWFLARTDPNWLDPFAFLQDKPLPIVEPKLPKSVIYPEIGWTILRSSWQNEATMLAVKSGFTWNHAHADAGSFILFHAGVPLITDSSSCNYERKEYGQYYVQPRAHNVVLFNGQGEPPEDIRRGSKFPGTVHSLLDGQGLKYVYADATGPMARYFSRNYRHWLWLDGVILIFDDIRAHEAGQYDWLLHYEGKADRTSNGAVVTNGRAKATVRFLHPEGLSVKEEQGLVPHRPDEKMPYLAFSTSEATRDQKFIVAVMPHVEGETLPELEPLSGAETIGVRVRHKGQVTSVYFNLQADGRRMHDNSNNTIDGWETDAYLLAIAQPAEPTGGRDARAPRQRYFVSCGSYLRKDGRVALDSLSKVDAVWAPGDNPEILLGGQELIEAGIGLEQRPKSLIVNGRATPFDYAPSARLARFRYRA